MIELVLSIFLMSIIAVAAFNILNSINELNNKFNEFEKNNENVNFGINYIKNEIDSSDYLIANDLRGEGFGLILINIDEKSISKKYSITTYAYKEKSIFRYNYKEKKYTKKIKLNSFDGKNKIIGNVSKFESIYDNSNKLLKISIEVDDKTFDFAHYIRGTVYENDEV